MPWKEVEELITFVIERILTDDKNCFARPGSIRLSVSGQNDRDKSF